MTKKKIYFLLVLVSLSVLTCAAWGRNPFPDKVEYLSVIGNDFRSFFRAAESDFFLRAAADNRNYPLFRWTSIKRTDARYPGYSNSPELRFFGIKVVEMILRFEDERLAQIYTVFYSRGDAKEPLELAEFNKLRSSLEQKLEDYTGEKGKLVTGKLTGNDRLNDRIYVQRGIVFELKSGIRKEQDEETGEFIQLVISRYHPKDDPRRQSATQSRTTVRRVDLKRNVEREPDGAIWLEHIPMVDQGKKGYCVPAVMERVLRYYGNDDVTQHTLAQVAGSTADKGTDVEQMIQRVREIGSRWGIRVSSVYLRKYDVKDVEKLVKDYNKYASGLDQPQIEIVKKKKGNRIYYMVDETMQQMQPEVELEVWKARKKDYQGFMACIRKNIGQGIPVIWSVRMGRFKEAKTPLEASGGHMRLIIGYNDKNDTIIYSDTWGRGHEKKSMPAQQAWTITTAYFTVTPR